MQIDQWDVHPPPPVSCHLSQTSERLGVLNGELEHNVLVRQGLVHLGECVQLGLNVHQVLGVQEDLQDLGAINLISNSLANNLGGVNNVLEDRLVHGGQGPRHRAGALLCGRSVEGLGEDSSLGNNHNVSAAVKRLKNKNKQTCC